MRDTTSTIGLNKHPFTESLRPLLPHFEELTGIKAAYVILPEEEFFEKLLIDLSSGGGISDVYMTSPMFEWRYQYAGWIEDLNQFWNNSELTDQEWYDRDDFYENHSERICGMGQSEVVLDRGDGTLYRLWLNSSAKFTEKTSGKNGA